MSESAASYDPAAGTVTKQAGRATLASGRVLDLRRPSAGELRGVKLLDVMQLDTGACAPVVARVSEMSELEFYALDVADSMSIMTELISFLAPSIRKKS